MHTIRYYFFFAVLLFGTYILVLDGFVSAETPPTYQSNNTIYFPLIKYEPCPPFSRNENLALQYHHRNMQNDGVWPCLSTGANMIVAVVDTGVNKTHFDLAANLLHGRSFIDGDYEDDVGHGSHVAGIIAGVSNNGGIVGTAPHAKILPVRTLSNDGGSSFDVRDGIVWAINSGARIINLSVGSRYDTFAMRTAVNYAAANDVLLVAAAGNCGDPVNWDKQGCAKHNVVTYPAAYGSVMAVGATNDDVFNSHASFSNQGHYLDVVAPGRNILSTWKDGVHAHISGTSMATPNVAGVAALVWSVNPSLSAQQVRSAINTYAIDLGLPGYDSTYGHGFVNSFAVIKGLESDKQSSLATLQVAPDLPLATPTFETMLPHEYVAGELLVGLAPEIAIESVLEQSASMRNGLELQVLSADTQHNIYRLGVTKGKELESVRMLQNEKGVLFAEPNVIFTLQ